MAEDKTEEAKTTPRRRKQPAKPKEGIFVGGTYVRKGDENYDIQVLRRCRVHADFVKASLETENFRIDLSAAKGGLPGWTYAGGGIPLEQALKAGA